MEEEGWGRERERWGRAEKEETGKKEAERK
jgi:hypothetical protein